LECPRHRPPHVEIDEIWKGMHDRKVPDHFSRDPGLGVRTNQSILGGHKRGGEESQAERKAPLPNSSPGWFTADLRSELIAEGGMID